MIHVISMLTHNDQTVDDAMRHYSVNKDAKTFDWGFKDTNISPQDAKILASAMRADGKQLFFESLVTNEDEALIAARTAVEGNFDYMVGMEYFPGAHRYLKESGVRYFPTCGRREGYPVRMLYGTINDIIDDANRILDKGVEGICLSVFRYKDGDPFDLAKAFVKKVNAPLVITGSINSDARLNFVKEVNPWGFTVGSALFEKDGFPGESISAKLDYISDYLSR